MNSEKLFNLNPISVNRVFYIETYKGNRIALKLIKLLKKDNLYKIKLSERGKDFTIFEVSILSKEEKTKALDSLVSEIISYIPDNFTRNYIFKVNEQPLGFINSFVVRDDKRKVYFSHKIKEINKNSILPKNQITVKK